MSKQLLILILFSFSAVFGHANNPYSWLDDYHIDNTVAKQIPTPDGYKRIEAQPGSFADWLRHLPVKPDTKTVRLYNGEKKLDQSAQHAVIDIDTGNRNLQQCADAVIRLRAEYLFSAMRYRQIHFNFTSGDRIDFTRWMTGQRPAVSGNQVTWRPAPSNNGTYASFRRYLTDIFTYAGSYSLSQELVPVNDLHTIQPGDVIMQGGFPGHCVIVIDVAKSQTTDEKLFLLAQSYMPAQDIHILKNPRDEPLSPWYTTNIDRLIATPDCLFWRDELMRFPGQ